MTGMLRNQQPHGKVYIVGAGPGDPDLITVKVHRLLQSADVILYDRLVAHELLATLSQTSEKIYVGKDPAATKNCSQEDINHLLIHHAKHGKQVIRLKGGDPLVFGRGSEEALACYAAGIAFEIVPGISSINGVTAYAGIPLTHRHISASFTVITGHEAPDKLQSQINYEAIARQQGTIVILMGVRHLQTIVTNLVENGLAENTPAACIERGTTQEQRVICASVGEIASQADAAQIKPPALTVIGDVVNFRNQGLCWFQVDKGRLTHDT